MDNNIKAKRYIATIVSISTDKYNGDTGEVANDAVETAPANPVEFTFSTIDEFKEHISTALDIPVEAVDPYTDMEGELVCVSYATDEDGKRVPCEMGKYVVDIYVRVSKLVQLKDDVLVKMFG